MFSVGASTDAAGYEWDEPGRTTCITGTTLCVEQKSIRGWSMKAIRNSFILVVIPRMLVYSLVIYSNLLSTSCKHRLILSIQFVADPRQIILLLGEDRFLRFDIFLQPHVEPFQAVKPLVTIPDLSIAVDQLRPGLLNDLSYYLVSSSVPTHAVHLHLSYTVLHSFKIPERFPPDAEHLIVCRRQAAGDVTLD